MAAADFFLIIDGIKGETEDAKMKSKGAIEITSWSWGATQSGTFAVGSGGGAGKAAFQDLHFTALGSKASPELAQACLEGRHIKSAELIVRKAGKEQQEYYCVRLTDVLISSYQSGGSSGGDALPVDQFSLNFAKLEIIYKPQKADGTLDAAVKGGWDL